MRYVSFAHEGLPTVGIEVEPGVVAPTGDTDLITLIADGDRGRERARAAAAGSVRVRPDRLLAPLRPGKILCCGINYRSHADENPSAVIPTEPFFFAKLPNAVIGPGDPIPCPAPSTHLDYEVELAVVIGKRARRVAADAAMAHVFGYTMINDVSAREVQFRDAQITVGKNGDGFCPLGPAVVDAADIADRHVVALRTEVNGSVRQDGTTAEWVFDVPVLLEFLTTRCGITLEPGDVVTTGTPAGVAAFRDPPPWLRPGDEVVVRIEPIGRLANPVLAGWAA
jgi:2-keto-4-pentenoate hydratase/2-oxohepta-3-ene-1,7-dioic acid hydratase in catechol pathway